MVIKPAYKIIYKTARQLQLCDGFLKSDKKYTAYNRGALSKSIKKKK